MSKSTGGRQSTDGLILCPIHITPKLLHKIG
nr:MAG TPA: hypothetical protein [Caudoviricetes sp.]